MADLNAIKHDTPVSEVLGEVGVEDGTQMESSSQGVAVQEVEGVSDLGIWR
jgi:hypothetical protein